MAGTDNAVNIKSQGTVYFNGTGTFSGLDGSTSGYVLTSNGTGVAPSFQAPTVLSTATTNTGNATSVAVTSSTSYVMAGIGASSPGTSWGLTPLNYTTVRVTIDGQCLNATNGDGINFIVAYGTGSPPAQGAAATGTTVGINTIWTALTGLLLQGVPFSKDVIITGLSAGTAYWFDLQYKAVTGGTASFKNINTTAQELTS